MRFQAIMQVKFQQGVANMKQLLSTLACISFLLLPAYAALPVGASAPDFSAPATLNGQPFDFTLSAALHKGPVVLYFYPKAFTRGCTYEAQAFARAVDDFARFGAQVVGVSNDKIEVLDKFSIEDCAGKFTVVSDTDGRVIAPYDAKLNGSAMASRISYVLTPDGKVFFAYENMDPDRHVALTLQALKDWKAKTSLKP